MAQILLKEQGLSSISESQRFGEELLRILAEPVIRNPAIFVEQIEGNHKSKQTNNQISDKYDCDAVEVYVQLQEMWIQLLVIVQNKQQAYPIFSEIMEELFNNAGLCSESAQETYRIWAGGLAIEQIANSRQLKPSTINDHLTEMAILYEAFPYEQFLNEAQLAYTDAKISAGETIDYNEIQREFPDVSFFQSRLMQVKGEVNDD